ncbi:hypothetical protein BJF96_g139 [Verticillium dahliae]|uniref:C2H2-type domain-containing protein n=1 Tax=Verticillium dahliae TaxID=27337 RepID=A0AA44WRH6_VERDA|nr:hypothetical protein BJF96_g139 [Verticillium dahliae]PNH48907.1 hypothetical protein VD0003_g8228 [Verticillium dahliae]
MDASQYSTNGINSSATGTGGSYPSPPPAVTPHQLSQHNSQQNSPMPHHTLPPLQPHPSAAMNQMYGSNPHTPRTPATPNTPTSNAGGNTNGNSMASYPNQAAHAGRGAPYQMQANYPPPPQGYATSSGMMPQSTMAHSHPQPIAPAPIGGRVPPNLRPMPPGGVMPQPGVQSPYGPGGMMQQSLPDGDQPTHVVGSQGRRGILPSAPGRPTAPQAGSGTAKSTVIPQKDADGKFPCPHCTKTYLHAKHLKRHLLRHTGDRPYMCVLCRDTFSRSDILKRHFQKCSIRRGNPSGATHLSHPQAHVKKNAAAQQKAAAVGQDNGDLNHLNGMNNMSADGIVQPFGMMPQVPEGMANLANDQNQLSRASSLNRMENGNGQDRRGIPGMPGNPRGGNFEQGYGGDVQNPMQPGLNQQLPNYNMPPGQNGMPICSLLTQIGVKLEPNPDVSRTEAFPGVKPTEATFTSWGLPASVPDPFSYISNQILNFFYPDGSSITHETAGLNLTFSPDNIKDFLEKYTHFHVHFPILHIATFNVAHSYTGLLAGMCCIGACYSDRVSADHVRQMMDFLRSALIRDIQFMSEAFGIPHAGVERTVFDQRATEELQAAMLMQIVFLWHGTPTQRQTGFQSFPVVLDRARKLGLLQVSTGAPLVSSLHQSNFSPHNFDVSTFNWDMWVAQEKRIRLMHIIFLCHAALELYFNLDSHLDSFDMQIPLPSDDAAWDSRTSRECEVALGLHGPLLARESNMDGTQRSTQPIMAQVLRTLFHSSYQVQPGSTNLYGKFILIHGILSSMRKVQLTGNASFLVNCGTPPLSDWMVADRFDPTTVSGRSTPVEGGCQMAPEVLALFGVALDKFKANWDADMVTQFPPNLGPGSARRYGFSRDGVHFYWMAKFLLKHTQPAHLQQAPDSRFTNVIKLLKSVRAWVMSDGASRGEELGSVGDIDKDFGAMDLTFDMAGLFKPVPEVVATPGIPSVQTNIGGIGGGMI